MYRRILLAKNLFSRAPFVEIDDSERVVDIHLPGIFAKNELWRVPLAEIAVVNPAAPVMALDGYVRGPNWVTESALRIPYASTRRDGHSQNLRLLFLDPQRTPRLSLLGPLQLGYGVSRRGDGMLLDGIQLRAAAPAAANNDFLAVGTERVDDPAGWIRAHHRTSTVPEQIQQVVTRGRRDRQTIIVLLVAMIALGFALVLARNAGRPMWILGVLGAAFLATGGLLLFVERRSASPPRTTSEDSR